MTRAATDAERVPASLSVLSEQRRQQVLAAVLAADPTLATARVETALAAVAGHPAALRSLAAALTADRSALVLGVVLFDGVGGVFGDDGGFSRGLLI